ncbi:TonB-dependent receptor [Sphingosinicella sp. LHD-64]|uniref:TonB-dependent receptor n=1 Tax=Sphingosinicella sp. LHD-64 TaxID=3072139 RepID=UPI00280E09D5|nr:TonB-dependent receptor [Sphingosinicella sp. LHD-64]MDQ8755888.1 TonB-dependent receptor [Sphingosinicella sp. LHD-64]
MMILRTTMLAGASLAALAAPTHALIADGAGDEIVVTAERTDRTLAQTAASVSVATQADVDRLGGAYSTDDVIGRTPNLVTTRPSSTAPAIRGIDGTGPAIGGDAFFGGTRPRVNFQVDNRTLSFNETIYIDGLLWDLQQIEVYRGPQSTLQGRNAIGGVVAVKTADPGFDWSGRARALIGEQRTRQISGAVGGPIVPDMLAFRVAADWRTDRSFIDFALFTARRTGLSIETREIEDPELSRSLTLRGKLLFTPSPDVRALLTVSHNDSFAPQDAGLVRPFEDHVASFPPMPRFRTRANVAIADTELRISDLFTLAFLGTVSDFRIQRFAQLGGGNALIDGREYTAEPRLRFGSGDDRVSGFIAGLIYRASQDEEIDLFDGVFDDSTETNAVFGEVRVRATPILDVTLGARYESEERDRTGGAGPFVIDFHRTFEAFLPRITVAVQASDRVTVGATVGRGYNAGGAGFSFEPPFPSYTYDKETVTNYEGFVRASLAGGRLNLRANVFFNDYAGLQLPFDINPDPAIFSYVIRNAERATTYGAEIETRFRALDGLTLFANAGLLKTRVNRYAEPGVEGNDLPRAPAFTLNAGLFAQPVAPLELSFDLRYTDAYYSDAFNNARGRTDPYLIANAQIAWQTGPARLFVAASNLFDTTDAVLLAPGATYAQDNGNIIRPRRVTAGVEVSF